nr:hypothetical protein BaRGS_014457 [Batillaria attramentaria]
MVVNPVFSFDIASMEECAQKCLEYGPLFPTFDYRFLIQVCNLFNVTALTADPGDFQIITNNVYTWSHFQRTCQ